MIAYAWNFLIEPYSYITFCHVKDKKGEISFQSINQIFSTSSIAKKNADGVKDFRNYRSPLKSDQVIDWKRAVWHYLWKLKLSSLCVKEIHTRCVMIKQLVIKNRLYVTGRWMQYIESTLNWVSNLLWKNIVLFYIHYYSIVYWMLWLVWGDRIRSGSIKPIKPEGFN